MNPPIADLLVVVVYDVAVSCDEVVTSGRLSCGEVVDCSGLDVRDSIRSIPGIGRAGGAKINYRTIYYT